MEDPDVDLVLGDVHEIEELAVQRAGVDEDEGAEAPSDEEAWLQLEAYALALPSPSVRWRRPELTFVGLEFEGRVGGSARSRRGSRENLGRWMTLAQEM